MLSVCLCARYQSNPKESHMHAVKKIVKYIKHTRDYGLWYLKQSHFDLCAYTDANFAGSKCDRKSTSGACYFLGNCLVSWHCKKQNSIALSTAEAEYISAGMGCAQILWMQHTLEDLGYFFLKLLYIVIVLVLLVFPKIRFYTLELNILRFYIILYERWRC